MQEEKEPTTEMQNSKNRSALEKFCTSKNISVEQIERAALFLPIRNFFKDQRNNLE